MRKTTDDLAAVEDDLRTLPPLPRDVVEVCLYGGWNRRGRPPVRFEERWVKVGRGVNGKRLYQKHTFDRQAEQPAIPLELSSRESTLYLIRAMRKAGWSKDQTFAMMMRWPAVGTAWFRAQKNIDAEFERCWAKAGLDKKDFVRDSRPKTEFISYYRDQERVYATIEANPGIHLRGLYEDGCCIDARSSRERKGHIDAAIKELFNGGFIGVMLGGRTNRTHYHFPLTLKAVMEPWAEERWEELPLLLRESDLDDLASVLSSALFESETSMPNNALGRRSGEGTHREPVEVSVSYMLGGLTL